MSLPEAIHLLEKVLPPHTINLVDIGAANFEGGRWRPFLNLLNIIGFEPQPKEFAKLGKKPGRSWINAAIAGRKEKRDFYVTKYWSNCSLLRPNPELTTHLDTVDGFDVVKTVEIECLSLDEALQQQNIDPDILKVDTQGSEHEIMQGAPAALQRLVAIEVEVEFCELYQQQPLFGDVDRSLREAGFILLDLGNFLYLKPRSYGEVGGAKGRLVSCDALYVRDPRAGAERLAEQGERKLYSALACFLAYGYPELGLVLLSEIRARGYDLRLADALSEALADTQPTLSVPRWLPARRQLARLAREAHRLFLKADHSLWWSWLGNKL